MYPQIFAAAKGVDHAFLIILGFSIFILVVVTLTMLWFLYHYNYRRNPEAAQIKGNIWAELIWTILPTLIVLGLFWTGWTSFKAMRTIPDGAMVVKVEGRMWSWKFTYANGKTSSELYIPLDTPVKLEMSARDVIHSFYVPAMRVKWDLVPGMPTDAWIESDTLGTYDIFCAEYCGLKHADMITLLKVVPEEEFDTWLEGEPEGEADKPRGLALLEEYGCFDCHTMDGTDDVAPPLNDLAGKQALVILPGGEKQTVKIDVNYLKTSILQPGAALVEGWGDEMPPYEGTLTDEEAGIIANFLLGRDENGKPLSHPGEKLAESEGCLQCHSIDGSDDVGPTFKGLFGKQIKVTRYDKQLTVAADEAYIRQSIKSPSVFISEGYDDAMPAYDDIDEETLNGLVSYIKSLGGGEH